MYTKTNIHGRQKFFKKIMKKMDKMSTPNEHINASKSLTCRVIPNNALQGHST